MKLGVKLITGFLVIALILVAVAGVSMVLGQQANDARTEADNEMENLQSLNELQSEIYKSHMLTTDYISNNDPMESMAIIMELYGQSMDIKERYANLTEEIGEDSEIAESWARIGELITEIGHTINEIYTLKDAGQLGVVGPISALNEKVEDIFMGIDPANGTGLNYVKKGIDDEMGVVSTYMTLCTYQLKVLNQLNIGLYREHTLRMIALSTDNLTVVNSTLIDIEIQCQVNDAVYTTLMGMIQAASVESEVHGELAVVLADTGENLDEMDEIFEENISLKMDDQLDNITQKGVIDTLNVMIDEVMTGADTSGETGFNSISESLSGEESGSMDLLSTMYAELANLNTLINSVYEDFMDFTTILTANDLGEAEALYEEMETREHEHEEALEALIASFEELSVYDELHAELKVAIESIEADFEEMHTIGHENITMKLNGTLDHIHWVSTLEEVVEECMIGEGADDEHGFDYVAASIKARSEESKADAKDAGETATIISLAGVIIALIIAIVMGIIMSRAISKPVVGMTEAAKKVREGDLDVSVDEKGSDEIAELGKAFNQMILSVRLVAGEMDMDAPDEAQDADPLATGESNGQSNASKDE
ncbi:MAG: HAMP domain-containing protein [Thermoplasmatota archaeon]